MTDQTHVNLRKAEKALNKLRNNINRSDLDYTVQASVSSVDPTVIRYAAQLTAPANGLAPITFIADTPEELTDKIKQSIKNINYDEIEKAYHMAQIEACNRTIRFHQERLNDINNPKSEDEALPDMKDVKVTPPVMDSNE